MPLVKNYRTYPVVRGKDGSFQIITGSTLEDTRGPFDTLAEAEAWVDDELARICRENNIPPHPAAGKHEEKL
jgi:hypothetical protein